MAGPKLTTEERFWSKVDRSGGPDACWPWTAGRNKPNRGATAGYGQFKVDGKSVGAHRMALILAHGPFTADKPIALHACDNPPCCNPFGTKHLFAGTAAENVADMRKKGRDNYTGTKTPQRGDDNWTRQHPEKVIRGNAHYARTNPELHVRGETTGTAKLNNAAVLDIRASFSAGVSLQALSEKYSVSTMCCRHVVNRKTWRHLP